MYAPSECSLPPAERSLCLQISVRAVGLNFRDVLNILGMYPGNPGDPGGDCAGVVSAVGPGTLARLRLTSMLQKQAPWAITSSGCHGRWHFACICTAAVHRSTAAEVGGAAGESQHRIGDEVLGLAPGCIGQSVVVPRDLMVPMPPQLSFQEAATTPTVYITVQTAFQQGAHFKPGTKVGRACSLHMGMQLQHYIWLSASAPCGYDKRSTPCHCLQQGCRRSIPANRDWLEATERWSHPLHVLAGGDSANLLTRKMALMQVLVHAGAGGVGIAAIQFAQSLGCTLLSTAGSASKRSYTRSIGAAHVASSRDTSFTDVLGAPPAGASKAHEYLTLGLGQLIWTLLAEAFVGGVAEPCVHAHCILWASPLLSRYVQQTCTTWQQPICARVWL